MFKRVFYFALVNIAVMVTISIILNMLGVRHYVTEYGINYQSLILFCGIWGMVGSFISLALSKFMAKRMMGVQIVEENSEYSHLVSKIHRLARSANLPKMPEVGVYDSPEINAFATGPSKSNSLVAVSTGLLHKMSDDEVEGVLAHEIAHIANGDMVTMALIQGVVNAFVMFFARIAAFAIESAMSSDDDDSPSGYGFAHMMTVFAFEIVFGILGSVVVAFFSRLREYSADAGGAKLAGKSKMIAALKKLQLEYESSHFDKNPDQNMSMMKISSKEVGFRAYFSSHPKLSDRIHQLEVNS
jgi:heat shock protein HtpX